MSELNHEAIDVIKRLGGNTKAAEFCEVSPQAVSQWRYNGIPRQQRKFLKVTRPDVFSDEFAGSNKKTALSAV